MDENNSVPFWWIALFIFLALGAGIGAITLVGGSILAAPLFVF